MRKLKERYTVNASQLEGIGSSISFLKRKLVRIPNGLALVPATSVDKLVHSFEQWFGRVRQMVPTAFSLRSFTTALEMSLSIQIGGGHDLARDRPDIMLSGSFPKRCLHLQLLPFSV